jgi:N,N'-diacetyllegionaminate synthase
MSVLVIAEVGVNHNGCLDLAKQLVDVAVEAGANLVKFQTFRSENIVTRSAPKAQYQINNTDFSQSQYEMLQKLELTPKMHEELIEYCRNKKIIFFSTAFDIEGLDYLAKLGMKFFKIPSGEITNLPYLQHVGSFCGPIILSSGMATLGEIEKAVDLLENAGTSRSKITVLHCNTEYPTPMHDVNLRAMGTIREALGVAVGYSDHTLGIEVPIAAVALGATVIEKHLTLNRSLPGPDHKASIEPFEFQAMVRAIRNIEEAMGSSIKRPSPSEIKNIHIARKSLIASKPILAGEIFTLDNIAIKRPGTGISPMRLYEVIGRVAARNFSIDELIDL